MNDSVEYYSSSTSRRSARTSSSRHYSPPHKRSHSPDRSWDHRRRRSPSPPSSNYKSSHMRSYDTYEIPRKRARTKGSPSSPEPKPTNMLDIYHPSVMGSKVMVRTLPDIKGMQLNLRDSPHREISQAQFDSLAENKKARLVQYYASNVRDPDVDHVIWTSVSVRALNPKERLEAYYFGAYACCWEKPMDLRGLAAAFQGVAKTNVFAEYSAVYAAIQACPSGDSVLIKTSSGPVAHALLRGTFPENNSTGPTPPHVTIRDALMNLVEKRRGRVYIRVVPSKSIIPVGAKVVKMAEKARRDYEALVLPESELPMNTLTRHQSPPVPTPSSYIQDTTYRGIHASTADLDRVLPPPPPPAMPQHTRWKDTTVVDHPPTCSPVENHRSQFDPSTSSRARDPRLRRMEQQQHSTMKSAGGGRSLVQEGRSSDAFSMSDNVDIPSQKARKLDDGTRQQNDDSDDDEIYYDAKDYLDDEDDDVSPPRRMAQVAIAAKGSISAWVNNMFEKYHIQ